jgi:hypothetical protein
MSSGIALGGVLAAQEQDQVSRMNQQKQDLELRKLGLSEEQNKQEQRKQQVTFIDQTATKALETIKATRAQFLQREGANPQDENLNQNMAALWLPVQSMITKAAQAGFPVNPDLYQQELMNILQGLSPGEQAAFEGRQTVNQAQGLADAAGVDVNEILQGQNVLPKPSDIEQRAQAAGFTPDTPEYQNFIRDATLKPNVSITNQAASLADAEKIRASSDVAKSQLTKYSDSADTAQREDISLDFIDRISDGVRQGSFEDAKIALTEFAAGLGLSEVFNIDNYKLGQAQGFKTAINDLVLTKAEKLSGTMSDKDIVFLKDSTVKLTNTSEGNALLIDFMKRANGRAMLRAEEAEEYFGERGNLIGFRKQWRKFAEGTPLYNDDDKASIEASTKGQKLEVQVDANGAPVWEFVNGKLVQVEQ